MKKTQNDTKKVTLKERETIFLKSYIKSMGNITRACKELGMSRKTYYRWMEKKRFREAFDMALEEHNDLIFQRILSLALKEDKEMLKFWAKTQMKHRGFVEKMQVEHSTGKEFIVSMREVTNAANNSKPGLQQEAKASVDSSK